MPAFFKKPGILLILLPLITALSACSKSPPEPPAAPSPDLSAPYDPPITLTTAVRTVANTEFSAGHSFTNTVWTKMFKSELGIDLEYLFLEDSSLYEQRLNIAINSGVIPDFMRVYDAQAVMMHKKGMLCDLTGLFEKYASPVTKQEMVSNMGGAYMAGAYINDRLMLLPWAVDGAKDWAKPLFIRKDWLKNTGLKPPGTIEEFLAVCDAFVNKDPDGNGKDDTYALGVAGMDNLLKDWGGLMRFFSAFDAQPGWSISGQLFYELDANGHVIWSGAKSGIKDALETLRFMYDKGYLAKDFGSMDSGERLIDDLCNSRFGMFFGEWWSYSWPLGILKKANPKSDWIVVMPPTPDGRLCREERYQPANSWLAGSTECKNPEAVIKMLNFYNEILYGMNGNNPRRSEITPPPGVRDAGMSPTYSPVVFRSPTDIERSYRAFAKAIRSGDASGIASEQLYIWESIKRYMEDPVANNKDWEYFFAHNPEIGYINYLIYEQLENAHRYIDNAYMGIMTDLMAERFPAYHRLAGDKITRIIYGQDRVASWDAFVREWAVLGNDAIIAEIESLRQ